MLVLVSYTKQCSASYSCLFPEVLILQSSEDELTIYFYQLSGQSWFKNLLDLPKTGLPTEHEDSFPLTLMVSDLGIVWRNACHCLPTQQCFFYLLMQWLLDSTQNSDSSHSCKTRPSQFIKFRFQDRTLKGYRPRCPILVEQLSCPPVFWGLLPWH